MKNILLPSLYLFTCLAVGCGGTETTPPNTDAGHDAGNVTDLGVDANVDTDAGADSGTDVDAGVDAGNPCLGNQGCFTSACTPAQATPSNTDAWFLNHCNDGYCSPFDNATRIPNYVGLP